jgi:hypothetical protein
MIMMYKTFAAWAALFAVAGLADAQPKNQQNPSNPPPRNNPPPNQPRVNQPIQQPRVNQPVQQPVQQPRVNQPVQQPVQQPKFNPPVQQPVQQPKFNPPPVVTQPKVVTPPVVAQPKVVTPPVVVQPKVVTPPVVAQPKVVTPPVVVQPKVVTPPVIAQPKVVTPPVVVQPKVVTPPVVAQPKVVMPPVVVQPKVVTPPVVAQPKVVTPPVVTQPKVVTPPVVAQPKVVTPPVVTQPKVVTPPVVAQPKVVTPPVGTQPKVVAPKIDNAKFAPTKVLPKIDQVKNPLTKIDPAKADPSKVALVQKNAVENRKLGEQSLIARSKAATLESEKARETARANFQKTLSPADQKKSSDLMAARLKQEQLLRDKVNPNPGPISRDPNKLLAKPATNTKDSAKFLSLSSSDNQKLINAKNSIKDPIALNGINDVLAGKKASPNEIAHLQSQLNNPNLSTGTKSAIATALQNQSDIRRQDNFVNSLSQLNGGGGGKNPFPGKQPFPGPGNGPNNNNNNNNNNNFGQNFAGGFAGGFLGAVVGNLVFPGSGVLVPPNYGPGVFLPGQIAFDPNGYTGYVDNGPAIYYPPTSGLDNSGSVLVQTIPCGCSSSYSSPIVDPNLGTTINPNPVIENPGVPVNTDEAGSPAVVIDPTSQEALLTTRYLRLINSSEEKVTVSIVLRTPSGEEGAFVWLPDEPGKGDGAFTVELLPGEEKDVFSGETPLHGSRARIWATGESGKTWRQFENTDFWLVPETVEDGTHAYAAPGVETAVYNLR